MLKFSEALDIVLKSAQVKDNEWINYSDSLGRVLADNVYSDINMPPFNKSAMDGYACRRDDIGSELEVVEVIQAGQAPLNSIDNGQCAQIMTGAMLPEGADTVIMVEQTEVLANGKIRITVEKSKPNICLLGEDVNNGDLVFNSGTLLGVRHIPVLATIGATRIKVYKWPEVAVLATGTELVEPENYPGPSQIRNSNAAQMIAQLKSLGLEPKYFGIAPDDRNKTYSMLSEAVEKSDILMLSGGVSMGEFDFVPSVLQELGFDLKFQRVAIQPGKPTTFGVKEGKRVFAFPGNPVSSFMIFELFAKPYIYKCMGHDWKPVTLRLRAGTEMKRKKTVRQSWFPIEINEDGKVVPLEYHGSAHIFALNRADGVIAMNVGQAVINEGDWVDVRQI